MRTKMAVCCAWTSHAMSVSAEWAAPAVAVAIAVGVGIGIVFALPTIVSLHRTLRARVVLRVLGWSSSPSPTISGRAAKKAH